MSVNTLLISYGLTGLTDLFKCHFLPADPPSPTLSPPTLGMREGASVSLKCSAPAPCLSFPPNITWTSGLGDSQRTMEELEEKDQVKTSVLNFTISCLHQRKEISCAATYSKKYGSTVSAVSRRLKAVVSCKFSRGGVAIIYIIEISSLGFGLKRFPFL